MLLTYQSRDNFTDTCFFCLLFRQNRQAALRNTTTYRAHEELVGTSLFSCSPLLFPLILLKKHAQYSLLTIDDLSSTGGPRKKAKLDDEDLDEAHSFSEAPFQFGKRRHGEEEFLTATKPSARTDSEDEDEDMYGPMPPPSSDGQLPPEAVVASQYEPYLKRVVQPIAKTSETSTKPKKSESWYVYGQDDLPDQEDESNYAERQRHVEEAKPQGEYDNDVLMDDENAKILPIRYEAYLKGHTKAVSALALDPSGVRLVSAGADFNLRVWDFSSMDKSLQSFRSMEPTENNLIHTLEWTKAGDKILLAANTPQAQILDREGRKLLETPRGYQYTTDMAHTTGHIHPITRAAWNPGDHSSFATCSQDATVRFWSLDNYKKHREIIKLKTEKGLNTCKPLCLNFDEKGHNLVVALDDGAIQIFPSAGPFLKPAVRINDAHSPNTATSHIAFVPGRDGKMLASRGGDDTLKIWDIRNTKTALASFPLLPNRFPHTALAFKPDGSVVATGTSNSREGDPGSIFFFDLNSFQLLKVVDVSTESIISLRWHKTTNQLLAGRGDGAISVFFDPTISSKGVMTSINKAMRKLASQKTSEIAIITPAIKEQSERERAAAARRDPKASHKPQNPISGRGSAGLLGSNLKADFMKRHLVGEHDLHEDPRAALLKHAHESDATSQLDYAGLKVLNDAEQARGEALEKAKKSRERK